MGDEIKGGHKKVIERIKKIFKNTQVVSIILTENNPQLFNWTDKTYWFANPIQWLNLFYHASFIYTDSFHGILFSIKFKKPFLSYYTEMARASRFIDLAHRFDNIANSIVDGFDDAIKKDSFHETIDYKELDKKLKFEVDKSISFLADSLNI